MRRSWFVAASAALFLGGAITSAPAHAADTMELHGRTYSYRSSGVLSTMPPVEDTVRQALDITLGAVKCGFIIGIDDTDWRVYNGTFDSIYIWTDPTSVTSTCGHIVTNRTQMIDRPLDGSGFETDGDTYTATGTTARVVASLLVDYPNVALASGSYHALTTIVNATDTATHLVGCAQRTWTYLATLARPVPVGDTGTMSCSPGSGA